MANDIDAAFDAFSKLCGNSAAAPASVKALPKIAKLAKDLSSGKNVKELGGYSKDIGTLASLAPKLAAAANAMTKATWPTVPKATVEAWGKWKANCEAHGPDSKQAQASRKAYVGAMEAYGQNIAARVAYLDALSAFVESVAKAWDGAGKQAYQAQSAIEKQRKKLKLDTVPGGKEVLGYPQVFAKVGSDIAAIPYDCRAVAKTADSEATSWRKEKIANETWLKETQKSNISAFIEKAMGLVFG